MWLDPILNLIFPPVCEVCKNPSQETLCRACFEQVKFMKPQLGIYSTAAYEGVVKTALHRLKFQKRRKLAAPLGIMAVRYLSKLPAFRMDQFDYIVPVPLHHKRLRDRGFNQSALLAETIGRYFEVPVVYSQGKKAVERKRRLPGNGQRYCCRTADPAFR
jgi:predicted amidophosphoribosyltransferase